MGDIAEALALPSGSVKVEHERLAPPPLRPPRLLHRIRPMRPAKSQALDDQLGDGLSPARPLGVKRPLLLDLIRQPGRKPNPKLDLPHVRLTSQTLGLATRNPRLRAVVTPWHLTNLK
jgi:hypothetical protein